MNIYIKNYIHTNHEYYVTKYKFDIHTLLYYISSIVQCVYKMI